MCFVDSLRPAAIQEVYLLAIGRLQRREHPDIAGLRDVGHVRWLTAEYNVILEAGCHYLYRFMGIESICDQKTGFAGSPVFSGRVEYVLHPMQVYFRVHVPLITACIVPIWGIVRDPRALYCLTGPDDQRRQASPVCRDALHCSDHGATQSDAATALCIAAGHQHFHRGEIADQYASLIHNVHILLQNTIFRELLAHDLKPILHLGTNFFSWLCQPMALTCAALSSGWRLQKA